MNDTTNRNAARDLAADLAVCDAATPGPWVSFPEHDSPFAGRVYSIAGQSFTHVLDTPEGDDRPADVVFAAEARDGWPDAIRRVAHAEAFKAWVHAFLDAVGVPHDPEPEHTARHGCRISGRMKFLLDRATLAEDEARRLRCVIDGLIARVAAQSELLGRHAEGQPDVRGLVIEVRRYVIAHGLLLGECVAWCELKKLVGVGQDLDCPSEH